MNPVLWQMQDVEAATGGRLAGTPAPVTGVSIDTRSLAPGDLFFAITGEARDGHDFVPAALEKGASAAVVAESRAADFAGGTVLAVPDVLDAMRALGLAARRRSQAGLVAVTGSVGKTGTKEALRLVLSRQGPTHASVASYNNHWGVPLTLARMPAESRFGVFEIGMNHAGEIAPLTRMVRPHVAVITTIEPVHIAYFRSIGAIADAKGEIFGGLEPGGTAVINRDSPYVSRMLAHAGASPAGRVLTFGEHPDADIRAERILLRPGGSEVEARILGRRLSYTIGSAGRHTALNTLAVLAAVAALGASVTEAAEALADLSPPAGRGERTLLDTGRGGLTLIDESYNANPASMRAALAALGGTGPGRGGRRIAVLADMLELGDEAAALHRGLVEAVEENKVDLVFTAGPLMASLHDALPAARRGAHAATAAEIESRVLAEAGPGDVVMVKGSNSTRISRVVKALKERYEAHRPAAASNG
jgi:UDP-N-acetylmuramoyl-tripeptide--D-alanyl-D-alanine ligase